MDNIKIGKPNSSDLKYIKKWLEEEQDKNGHSFLCNWNIIENAFNQKNIFILREGRYVIAFYIIGYNNTIEIFCVKEDKRNNGYGRKLFEYYQEKIINKKFSIVEVQCSPPESIHFWQCMGFIGYKKFGSQELFAYKIINPKYNNIKVKFFEEGTERIFCIFDRKARLVDKNYILNEKIIFDFPNYYKPDEGIKSECDVCVEILIDEKDFYKGRAKYGRNFGIEKIDAWLFVINELKKQPLTKKEEQIEYLEIFGNRIHMAPGSFIVTAQYFLDCAKNAQDVENRWNYNPARHFLACRAIELALKGFLSLQKNNLKRLTNRYGHNIGFLLKDCEKDGLYSIVSLSNQDIEVIQEISNFYENKYFEYPDCEGMVTGGPSRYPDAQKLINIADNLITNLYNPCIHNKHEIVGEVTMTIIKNNKE